MNKEISWINSLRAISMISVYILHSEAYYGFNGISYGALLQPFYVNAFFFVSGFLFFRKHFKSCSNYSCRNFYKDLQNIIFRLIIPTIIFSTILYIPKLLFHNRGISINQYLYDVWGGISFWFTSTITVSQVILLLCLLFVNKKTIWPYFFISVILFAISVILGNIDKSPFPWYYKSGLGALLFLTLGGIYYKYEDKINMYRGNFIGYIIVISYFVCAFYGMKHGTFAYAIMSMNFNVEGFFMSILGIIFIVFICKKLPVIKIISYIGKNSILFYFFSGAFPASIGYVLNEYIPEKTYIATLFVAFLSLGGGLFLTFIINRYIPWLTDIRTLKKL